MRRSIRAARGTRAAQPTKHFTPSTCRNCQATVLTGTIYGLRLNLEPHMLDDQAEYNALLNNVPTYDLWPDLTARRRHLEEINPPDRVPRHAQHTCGTQYGTHPHPKDTSPPPPGPDDPPPF